MCGFAGYYSFDESIEASEVDLLKERLELLQHRGPDHTGFFQSEKCILGHQRLSIIDPDQRSHQPFFSIDKKKVIVFNGEIYNYQELRSNMEADGLAFQTHSDTEVLLNWIERKGKEGLTELNGCFSFAFFDLETKELLLGRDPMGINPLFVLTTEKGISFASERKGLPQTSSINWKALNAFLSFTYIPGSQTGEKEIQRLPAGASWHFNGKKGTKTQHFHLAETFHPQQPASDKELYQLMDQAVQDRLVADVPVGTFLSGGLDSSIVSALAAKHHDNLNTFSIGFENPVLDESPFAREVAQHIGSKHHHFVMNLDDLERHARLFLEQNDELFADSSALAVSFLAEQTRKEVKVALSGDGADELFGGYRKHRALLLSDQGMAKWGKTLASPFEKQFSRESKLGEKMRQLHRLGSIASIPKAERISTLARFHPIDLVRGAEADAYFDTSEGPDQLEQRMLFLDQQWVLEGDMLTKQDRMSMLHSLEVRVPFLDPRVVRYANGLVSSDKYTARDGKIALKSAFRSLLPESIFQRKKHGFEVPLDQLLRERFQDEILALLRSGLVHSGPMKTEITKDMILDWQKGNAQLSSLIWCLLVGQRWMEKYGVSELSTNASS